MKKIYCIFKQGRESRLKLIQKGQAPKEFFYGFFGLIDKGYHLIRMNNNFYSKNIILLSVRFIELFLNHLHRLGLSPSTIYQNINSFSKGNIILTFTDGMSLTLGFFSKALKKKNLYIIGCFHCLSDYDNRSPFLLKLISNYIISQSLKKLDHIAFFGPADRQYAIKKYNLNFNKTSIIKFGVDTNFWVPKRQKIGEFIFSIGQDPNRDFETLIKTNVNYPIRIHTELNIEKPSNKSNITITKGSYNKSTISDIELRNIYQKALIIVIPLKDVYQPTGYSVTLQAMACGKPVILSNIKGLWAPEILKHKFNCLLVPPSDSKSLEVAIINLLNDKILRDTLSKNARKTALKHFNLENASDSLEKIIRKGF